MFWVSVINGLKMFLHWETYVLSIAFWILSFLPFIALMYSKHEKSFLTKTGLLLLALQPALMVLAIFIFVSSLFPIILGVGDRASWNLPWILMYKTPLFVAILLFVMTNLSYIVSKIPIIGHNNSFIILIVGGAVLFFLHTSIDEFKFGMGINHISLIPNFFTIIGIVAVSVITSWLAILIITLITTPFGRFSEDISHLLILPIGTSLGFLPVFIYGAWLGLQLT